MPCTGTNQLLATFQIRLQTAPAILLTFRLATRFHLLKQVYNLPRINCCVGAIVWHVAWHPTCLGLQSVDHRTYRDCTKTAVYEGKLYTDEILQLN